MSAQGNALGSESIGAPCKGAGITLRPCRAEEVPRTRSRGVAPGWNAPRPWRVNAAEFSIGENCYGPIYEIGAIHESRFTIHESRPRARHRPSRDHRTRAPHRRSARPRAGACLRRHRTGIRMESLGRALRAWISLALRRAVVYGREAERHGGLHALDVVGPDAGDGTGRARVWLRGRLAPRALRSRDGRGSGLSRPLQTNGEIPRRRPRRAPRMEWRRRSQLSG